MTLKPKIEIDSRDSLLAYLKTELGYCGCGYYEDAIRVLRDILQFASDRQDASRDDAERFSLITRDIEKWTLTSPGLATWFVWLLDKHGFIWHGFNETDIWVSKKGMVLLNAIKRYYEFRDPPNGDTKQEDASQS